MRDQCATILVISDGSRPPHKREEDGHPDPEIGGWGGGGGCWSQKKIFGPSGPVWSKNKGAGAGSRASSLDPPLVIALVTSN